MKFLKKIFKKVGKGIKKAFKGVGKLFKKVFKGVGKFVGKLGPIGMIGMTLLMPTMAGWWGQFGTWASKLAGPMGTAMKTIAGVGNRIGTAYTSLTNGVGTVVEGFADSVGLGNAYRSGKVWVNDKVRSLQDTLGLEQSPLEEMGGKGGSAEVHGRGEFTPEVRTEIKGGSAQVHGRGDATVPVSTDATDARTLYRIKNIIKTGYNEGKKWNTIWNNIRGMAQNAGLTEEQALEQYGGSFVADTSVHMSNTVNEANEQAQNNWLMAGNVGQPLYGAGSQLALLYQQQQQEAYSYAETPFHPTSQINVFKQP